MPRLDLNVLPVFDMGITGQGINVAILDDGIEHTHTDLIDNYVSYVIMYVPNELLNDNLLQFIL